MPAGNDYGSPSRRKSRDKAAVPALSLPSVKPGHQRDNRATLTKPDGQAAAPVTRVAAVRVDVCHRDGHNERLQARATPSPNPTRGASRAALPLVEKAEQTAQPSPAVKEETDDKKQYFSRVRVAVRVRPPTNGVAVKEGQPFAWPLAVCEDEEAPTVLVQSARGERRHTFDWILSPGSTQEEVYNCCARDLVDSFLQGYNATLLAYGQTASGKTYTMGMAGMPVPGETDSIGVLPRAAAAIFQHMERQKHSGSSYDLSVQFLEVYQEEVMDLLAGGQSQKQADGAITIRKDDRGEVVALNAVQKHVSSFSELMHAFQQGAQWRSVGATRMNDRSSRSHAIFTLLLTRTWTDANGTWLRTRSKLHLVDLAGSERQSRTGAEGQRLKESSTINSGLLALGKVVHALARRDSEAALVHVPLRDSKLTRLLADSLGGTSATVMVACVSPDEENAEETVNTVQFAARAQEIKSKQELQTELVPDAEKLAPGERECLYPLTPQDYVYRTITDVLWCPGSTPSPVALLEALTQDGCFEAICAYREGRSAQSGSRLAAMRGAPAINSQDLMAALFNAVQSSGVDGLIASARGNGGNHLQDMKGAPAMNSQDLMAALFNAVQGADDFLATARSNKGGSHLEDLKGAPALKSQELMAALMSSVQGGMEDFLATSRSGKNTCSTPLSRFQLENPLFDDRQMRMQMHISDKQQAAAGRPGEEEQDKIAAKRAAAVGVTADCGPHDGEAKAGIGRGSRRMEEEGGGGSSKTGGSRRRHHDHHRRSRQAEPQPPKPQGPAWLRALSCFGKF